MLIEKVADFAEKAHEGQTRKYTMEPYFCHVERVAKAVEAAGFGKNMIALAYLHDVIEDCDVSYDEIRSQFGKVIADYCMAITKVDYAYRSRTLAAYNEKLKNVPVEVQIVKVFDILDNLSNISEFDEKRAVWYADEKAETLKHLDKIPDNLKEAIRAAVAKAKGIE